ncbi:hypothetical protein V8B97DRAFT_1914159 [Scleroderma yunnanense]
MSFKGTSAFLVFTWVGLVVVGGCVPGLGVGSTGRGWLVLSNGAMMDVGRAGSNEGSFLGEFNSRDVLFLFRVLVGVPQGAESRSVFCPQCFLPSIYSLTNTSPPAGEAYLLLFYVTHHTSCPQICPLQLVVFCHPLAKTFGFFTGFNVGHCFLSGSTVATRLINMLSTCLLLYLGCPTNLGRVTDMAQEWPAMKHNSKLFYNLSFIFFLYDGMAVTDKLVEGSLVV